MPNHVRNILVFEGNNERIEELKAFVRGTNGDFDFNKFIPMPKTLNIPSGSGTNLALLAAKYLRGLIPPKEFEKEARRWLRDDVGVETPDELLGALVRDGRCDVHLGDVVLDNIRDHGFPTWYEWSIERWGSKWNAYGIEAEGREIRFSTAWSAPLPVIGRLAGGFPDITIEHFWADEDMGNNCGHNTHRDGGASSDWIMDGGNEAFDIFIRCWGQSDCMERDDGGNWRRADCEVCAKCG